MRKLIRKILNEEVPSQVRRRFSEYDRIFKHYRKSFLPNKYRNSDIFWNMLMEVSMETLYHAWFSKTVSDDDWDDSSDFISEYLTKKYKDETKQMWEKKHHKRLNESKTINYPKLINDILSSYKEEDFICDIDVSYYNEVYEIAVKIDKKEFEKKYENIDINYATILMKGYLDRLKRNIRQDIITLLPVDVLVWFRQINCDKKLNESEDKGGKYISLIEDLTEIYKNEDCVCDIQVEHKPEEFRDLYLINVVLGIREINSKFKGINHQVRNYINQLRKNISKTVHGYLPLYFLVTFSDTPKCYKDLQESEEKKPSLVSMIEEHGLHDFISMTGLSIKQIYEKTGELPREVFEGYIKDFLENDKIGWDLSIQISPNKIVNSFYLSDDVVTIEVLEVDSRGRVLAGSFERLSVLSDGEIFSLVDEMTQINNDFLDYM